MQIKREINPIIKSIENIFLILLCFTPILFVLLVTREFFLGYLYYALEIVIMGFLISIVFKYYKQVLKLFMLPSYEEMIAYRYISTYYIKFILNAFCLTFAISIVFYDENATFLQYSYPALAFLCASRILQNRNKEILGEFFEVIYGLVIAVILFAFMKLMGLFSKLEATSLLALPFINIPNITKDLTLFVLLSLSVWVILLSFEQLMLVKRLKNKMGNKKKLQKQDQK
jgi:hypothetical protein